jgi:predicted DNA-binding transcriptional regulator
MTLVEKARKFGINSKEVQREQEIFSRSKNFRVYAVYKLGLSSGSKTAGIDGKLFLNTGDFKSD